IRIKLPALDPAGLYRLEVSATLPNGNPVALEPILIDTSERYGSVALRPVHLAVVHLGAVRLAYHTVRASGPVGGQAHPGAVGAALPPMQQRYGEMHGSMRGLVRPQGAAHHGLTFLPRAGVIHHQQDVPTPLARELRPDLADPRVGPVPIGNRIGGRGR